MIKLFSLLVSVAIFVLSGPAQALGLQMSLADAGDNTVEVTLKNQSLVTHTLLKWETPFESELAADTFLLINEDNQSLQPRYSGKLLKRGEFKDSDFFVLQPGEQISSLIKLTDYYDINVGGNYRVTAAGHFNARQSSRTQLTHADVLSKSISMNLSPSATRAFAQPAETRSCSADQINSLDAAVLAAERMAILANNDIKTLTDDNVRASSPRLTTWFGQYDNTRFSMVDSVYTEIVDAIDSKQMTLRCDCPARFNDAFAFVIPILPYEITLCSAFWNAPLEGFNSKAGTLIHELSHFTVIGGTDDHAYGPNAVQQLARTSPTRAVNNADSYEYFAENTPAIALLGEATNTTTTNNTAGEAQSVSGVVLADSTAPFNFTGTGLVTLTSVEGDADLEVYSDGTRVCSSTNPAGQTDSCDLTQFGAYDVIVVGYTNATYELQLLPTTTVRVQSGDNTATESGGSSGGGIFSANPLLFLLAFIAFRSRHSLKLKQILPCSLGFFLLTGCQVPVENSHTVATNEGVIVKNTSGKTTPLQPTKEATAVLQLESSKKKFMPDEQVEVMFSLHNNSDKLIEYLPWGTALEADLTADVFSVEFEGTELTYRGPLVKRREPVKEDNDILQPGESREVVVKISDSYDMALPGAYTINWRNDGALAYQLRSQALALPESVEILKVTQ